jgi:hypothetical protein
VGEEEMVAMTLTKEMIEAGATLVRNLDTSEIKPDAAFWLYYPDAERWRLVLAEANLDQGLRPIYEKIQEVFSSAKADLQEISLDDVTLTKSDSPIVVLLRDATRRGKGTSGIRFTNIAIQGTFIDDAYIYRIL